MGSFFELKQEHRGPAAVTHIKKVYENLQNFRATLSTLRASIALSSPICAAAPLGQFKSTIDAFDTEIVEALDDLSTILGEAATGAIELDTAAVLKKAELAAGILKSTAGDACPASLTPPASATETKPVAAKPPLQQLIAKLQQEGNKAAGSDSGGSL